MLHMQPDIASVEDATQILTPHIDDLGKLFSSAWNTWTSLPHEVQARHTRRTRASWIHDDLSEEARALFGGKPEVDVVETRGFLAITFSNVIVMRFKKFRSKNLRTSGIMTQQRLEYETQQFALPGLPSLTTTVAGYLLDSLEQKLGRLAVVCPFNGDNMWVIDIPLPGEGGAIHAFSSTSPNPTPTVEIRSAREIEAQPDQKEEV